MVQYTETPFTSDFDGKLCKLLNYEKPKFHKLFWKLARKTPETPLGDCITFTLFTMVL